MSQHVEDGCPICAMGTPPDESGVGVTTLTPEQVEQMLAVPGWQTIDPESVAGGGYRARRKARRQEAAKARRRRSG
jgi:hypothetical protein